jgi:glycosyltransferase involved in cell wall biosynthesis
LIRPKVTIGVCVKNGASHIGDAIKSIISQDFPHELMEVIFVDDGSTDKTLSIIESNVLKMDIHVKIFHHKWKGLGYSRNMVVNNANSEYIIWVDGDMVLSRDFVRKQVEFMDGNQDVGIAKGRYGIDSSTSLVAYLQNIDAIVEFVSCGGDAHSKPLGTGGSVYRVEAIRKVGGFNGDIKGVGEDMDAEYRIKTSNWLLQTTEAEFYEKRRKNWRDLWNEYFWHGCGGRIIFNKVSPHSMLYKMFPPTIILTVISRSCKAYRLTRRKVVFFLPLQWIFKRIAWCLGFVKSM